MKKFSQRQQNERNFHNRWASSIKINEVFYKEAFESPTAIENQYIFSKIMPLKSKKILDLGCGLGDATIYFAKKGAIVYAIDISEKMVNVTRKIAIKERVINKVKVRVMTAENLLFKKNFFDYVYGNGILHHSDLNATSLSLKKILKKGGCGFFIEPLSYNPIVNVYRKFAHEVRSKDERPLSLEDIKNFGKQFVCWDHTEFHFFTLLIFVWFFLGKRVNPNKERYWKKILIEGKQYSNFFNFLYQLDRFFLGRIPFLRKFCWTTVIFIKK